MKRAMFAFFVMFLALVSSIQVQDSELRDGVPQMGRYYSDDTFMFAAMRIDSAYIDQLSTFFNRVTSAFADLGVPQVDLHGLLSMVTGGSDVFTWLGDYAAFGYSGDPAVLLDPSAMNGASPSGIPSGITAYGVIELRDAAAAEAFLASVLPSRDYQTPVDADYPSFMTVDGTSIVITPTAAYVLPPGIPFLDTRVDAAPTFDANTTFTTVTGHLPAPGYNALVYANANIFVQATQLLLMPSSSSYGAFKSASAPQAQVQAAVPSIPVAIGLTILNSDTLTIDVATMAGGTPSQTIDPDFMRFLPANAGAVVHATNLTGLYDTVMTLAASSAGSSSMSPDQQVEAALQAIGLDLREDVLSWTTGDYALFARADLVEIARGVNANKLDVNGLYDFGLIMEATDPALASAFAEHINTLLTQAVMADSTPEYIQINQETFGTTEATVYELHIASDTMFSSGVEAENIVLPIAVGANDDVFFIATAGAAEAMFAGGSDSLKDTSAYQDATTYFLPNPTSVWYTSGDGFLLGMGGNPITAVTLFALSGSAIGNVFENIVMDLNGTPMPLPTATPTPTPVPTMTAAQIEQEVAPIIALNTLIRSSTISSTTTDDGATLVRMTISLNIGE